MKRYTKIYIALLRINAINLFAYRANFLNSVISCIVWSSFVIFSMTILTAKTSHIFGWTRNELLLMAGIYNVIYSIFYAAFSRNFEDFPFRIHQGILDGMLLKPLDSQFFMSSWFISIHQIVRLAIGIGFIVYLLTIMPISVSLQSFLFFSLFIICSVIILYSFWFIVMTITIWQSHLRNLVDLLYSINGLTRYPQEIYKKASPIFLWLIFPLTLVVTVPTRILEGKGSIISTIVLVTSAVISFTISRFFWKFALRSYTSVSS